MGVGVPQGKETPWETRGLRAGSPRGGQSCRRPRPRWTALRQLEGATPSKDGWQRAPAWNHRVGELQPGGPPVRPAGGVPYVLGSPEGTVGTGRAHDCRGGRVHGQRPHGCLLHAHASISGRPPSFHRLTPRGAPAAPWNLRVSRQEGQRGFGDWGRGRG